MSKAFFSLHNRIVSQAGLNIFYRIIRAQKLRIPPFDGNRGRWRQWLRRSTVITVQAIIWQCCAPILRDNCFRDSTEVCVALERSLKVGIAVGAFACLLFEIACLFFLLSGSIADWKEAEKTLSKIPGKCVGLIHVFHDVLGIQIGSMMGIERPFFQT